MSMIQITVEPEQLFRDHPEAKSEFLAWATSDQDFLESFVALIATGWSNQGSHPAYLDRLREDLHTAMGDEYHAKAMQQVQDAKLEAQNARVEAWRTEYRLKKAKELMPLLERSGHAIEHAKTSDRDFCPACQIIDALKGE